MNGVYGDQGRAIVLLLNRDVGATEPLDHPGVRGQVGSDALDCEAGPSGGQGCRNEHLITKVHIESHARSQGIRGAPRRLRLRPVRPACPGDPMRRPRQDRDRIRRRGTGLRPDTRPSRMLVRRALRSHVRRATPVPWPPSCRNAGFDTASTDRVPSGSYRLQFGDDAHFSQHRAPDLEHIVCERRLGQVGTAFDRHGRRPEARASASRTVCRMSGADPALPPFLAEATSKV